MSKYNLIESYWEETGIKDMVHVPQAWQPISQCNAQCEQIRLYWEHIPAIVWTHNQHILTTVGIKDCAKDTKLGYYCLTPEPQRKTLLSSRNSLNIFSEHSPGRTLKLVKASKSWRPIVLAVLYENWNTKQYRRANCIFRAGFAAFGLGVQLISWNRTPFSIFFVMRYKCHIIMRSNHIWTQAADGKTVCSPCYASWKLFGFIIKWRTDDLHSFTKSCETDWAIQLTRLLCLVVYIKFRILKLT